MGKKADILTIAYRVEPDGIRKIATGRVAWALRNLVNAGDRGCTPIDHPGPRWGHYVFRLRRAGVSVETIHEAHGGPFAGHHARYVLHSIVTIMDDSSEAQRGGLAA